MRTNLIRTPLDEGQQLRLFTMVKAKMPIVKAELVEITNTILKQIEITYENGSIQQVIFGDDMFDFLMNGIKVVRIS